MPSASAARLATLALAAFVAGCASVSAPMDAIRDAVTPSSSGAAAPAPPRTGAAAFSTPVNPATQRAFDEASSALRSGRTAEAEGAFKALASANPDLGGPHANLGVIYRNAGKLPEAVTEFQAAVKLSPAQPVYLNQLGVTYRQQGEFAKAREAYQRAIALDPRYAPATLNLGILYDLYLGDAPHALEQYNRYLALLPAPDPTVTKWVADLKNRKPAPITVSRQEKP
jgi:tetratricopeptide (TPR) repeat protein